MYKNKASASSSAARADDNKNGHAMAKSRVEEYRQAFALFDANKDGFITIDELEKAMKRFGKRISRLELSLIMHHADNDQNGVLTFDEFANILDGRQEMPKFTYSQLREQFDMFDRDHDGFIEKDEMMQCVAELALTASFPLPVVEQLFREADVDGDGKISFEEFVLAVN